MNDAALACLVLVLCLASALVGRTTLARLPETHRSRETLTFVQTASSLLVTFTALVLGLLITSVNADFKKADADLHDFAASMIRLDAELLDIGPSTRDLRIMLRAYAASAIASTWPEEPKPAGSYPVAVAHGAEFDARNLAALLDTVALGIRKLETPTPLIVSLQAAAQHRISTLRDLRWTLIGEASSLVTPSLAVMMVFWLLIVFFSFGLTAPPNRTAGAMVLLVALAVASAIFMVLELDGPLDGLIKVGSEPLRHALVHIDEGLAS